MASSNFCWLKTICFKTQTAVFRECHPIFTSLGLLSSVRKITYRLGILPPELKCGGKSHCWRWHFCGRHLAPVLCGWRTLGSWLHVCRGGGVDPELCSEEFCALPIGVPWPTPADSWGGRLLSDTFDEAISCCRKPAPWLARDYGFALNRRHAGSGCTVSSTHRIQVWTLCGSNPIKILDLRG